MSRGPAFRIGQGYDVHRLTPGRDLILGGVRLDHHLGLDGHSDADVLCHAVTDALLGAAGLGDIGRHFPDTEPAWKGADSLDLLARAAAKVRKAGWLAVNVDATLLAERPKIAPHVPLMEANLARALGVEPGAVSIKATTTEGLGPVGRQEGMAALAVALIQALPDQ